MRYAVRPSRPKTELWSDDPLLPSITVDGEKEVDTGLVSERGDPIMRLPNPIGFGRDHE